MTTHTCEKLKLNRDRKGLTSSRNMAQNSDVNMGNEYTPGTSS
jgi:hypothetical protein